jgi:GAF domain-containing protein
MHDVTTLSAVTDEPKMQPRPLRPDEAERLLALRQSGLMETGTDMRLDALVHRAAMLFNMPIAAISLIDETRHVVKSSIGVGMSIIPRDLSFCAHTIMGTDPMVVPDAKADERFADNALVTGDPGLRFYVGAPVYGRGNLPLGALCVMDTRADAQAATPEKLAQLQALAAEVSAAFSAVPDIALKRERGW